MLIFAIAGIMVGFFSLLAFFILNFGDIDIGINEADLMGELFLVSAATTLFGSAILLITGIVGIKNHNKPEKANVCIVFALIAFLIAIVYTVLEIAGGQLGPFQVIAVTFGLTITIVYLLGSLRLKN